MGKDNRRSEEGRWQAADDNRVPNPEYQPPKAIVDTDEGYWHDREVIPNPAAPVDLEGTEEFDKREKVANASKHDTKVIMAHELRENPEGFKAMAEKIADSYNKTHTLKVGEALPEQLEGEKDKSWVFDPIKGYERKEKKDG